MPNIDKEKARKTVSEISRIILDEDLVKAFQSVGEDKALLDKAKADPKAFLKKQGFTFAAPTEIKMTVRRMAPTSVGSRVPRFKLKLCFLVSYTIAEKTPFEHDVEFNVCKTYLIF